MRIAAVKGVINMSKVIGRIDLRPTKIICPFWQNSEGKTISCEGYFKRSYVTNRFPNQDRREAHQSEACERHDYAKKCPHAAKLQEIYRGEKK
jgi:hypothetical protein